LIHQIGHFASYKTRSLRSLEGPGWIVELLIEETTGPVSESKSFVQSILPNNNHHIQHLGNQLHFHFDFTTILSGEGEDEVKPESV
jgi:hypothetical protein